MVAELREVFQTTSFENYRC